MSWFTVLRLLLLQKRSWMIQHFCQAKMSLGNDSFHKSLHFSKSFKVFHCSVINVHLRMFCYAFFVFRSSRSARLYYHDVSLLSTLFYIFFKKYFQANGEGGIWTLAPLLTTCTLSRGVPSASLGTSPNSCSNTRSIEFCVRLYIRKRILSNSFFVSVTT